MSEGEAESLGVAVMSALGVEPAGGGVAVASAPPPPPEQPTRDNAKAMRTIDFFIPAVSIIGHTSLGEGKGKFKPILEYTPSAGAILPEHGPLDCSDSAGFGVIKSHSLPR